MVKVQIGVLNQHFGYIDPSKMKCLSCGKEFNYPYCDWAGGIMVIFCCPGCRKPITEYTNYQDLEAGLQHLFLNFPDEIEHYACNGC